MRIYVRVFGLWLLSAIGHQVCMQHLNQHLFDQVSKE
jgi:hypothetical protein